MSSFFFLFWLQICFDLKPFSLKVQCSDGLRPSGGASFQCAASLSGERAPEAPITNRRRNTSSPFHRNIRREVNIISQILHRNTAPYRCFSYIERGQGRVYGNQMKESQGKLSFKGEQRGGAQKCKIMKIHMGVNNTQTHKSPHPGK